MNERISMPGVEAIRTLVARSPIEVERACLLWTNAVCFLITVVAALGINPPTFTPPSIAVPTAIPVLFVPPVVDEPLESMAIEDLPLPSQDLTRWDNLLEQPVIEPLPAVADPSQVAFAVPTEGWRRAPPAAVARSPLVAFNPVASTGYVPVAAVTTFKRGVNDGGYYPDPDYPREALKKQLEGKVLVLVKVEPSGAPVQVRIRDSSGFDILDDHVEDWVRDRWHWPPGGERYFLVPFQFFLRKTLTSAPGRS